jgi:hypothetical protein
MTKIKVNTEFPNELDFVDDDIRKAFEGTNYFVGTPTNIQLSRNLKMLSENIQKLIDKVTV